MILVTGANGRAGSAVVRAFARRSEPVRALVRDPARASVFDRFPTVEVVTGDMLRPETLGPALDGVDRVLVISSAGPQMLETQATFIDAALAAGATLIVKFSGEDSIEGFDPERFRSTRSHEQIQRYLTAVTAAWTILRPSQFMEAYLEEAPAIAAAGELRLPLGATTLAPVAIDDVARVAHAVLTTDGHEGATYTMTGPEALTMTDVAANITAAIGRTVRYVDVTPEEKAREWLDAGYPPERAAAFSQLFAERHRLGRSCVHLDTHERFGVEPTTFAQFARVHADLLRGDGTSGAPLA